MIRKLKMWGARGLFLFAVAAALGFGVIAAAMAAVIGGLLVLGVRLAEGLDQTGRAERPSAPDETTAQPA